MATLGDIIRGREQSARVILSELRTTAEDERLPAAYRAKRTAELKGDYRALNREAQLMLQKTLDEHLAPARARIGEGIRFMPDELQEADMLARQFAGTPKRLAELVETALDRGATRRARIAFKAAQITAGAGAHVGRFEHLIAATDPELVDARATLASVNQTVEALNGDVARERASILYGKEGARASIAAKGTAQRLGLPPATAEGSVSFTQRILE